MQHSAEMAHLEQRHLVEARPLCALLVGSGAVITVLVL